MGEVFVWPRFSQHQRDRNRSLARTL